MAKRKRRSHNIMEDAPGIWSVTQIGRLLRLAFYILFRILFDGIVMVIYGVLKLLTLVLFKITGKAFSSFNFKEYVNDLISQFNDK